MSWTTRMMALSRARLLSPAKSLPRSSSRWLSATSRSPAASAEQQASIDLPPASEEDKAFPPKIVALVDEIEKLNLLEVADLNSLLKTRLKISDAPVMMAAGGGGGAAAAPQQEEEEEEAAPVAVQTSFTVKLGGFDAAKKVALIKELKAQVEGMNLVQAKKFVESAPATVKADIGKEEAEALKKALEAAGAEITIE